MSLLSSSSKGTLARASSVLQRNTKLYGPMNALDVENSSSCWNSEGSQGDISQQWLLIDFGRPVRPEEIRLQFQAGFVAESCAVEAKLEEELGWKRICDLEFSDVHNVQSVPLETEAAATSTVTALKLILDDFTDFYGRVTIYRLEVWGKEADSR